MNLPIDSADVAIKTAYGSCGTGIARGRTLVDVPHLALVELDVPEYTRNGLGRMLGKAIRYQFEDGCFGGCARSICADSSGAHMIYADMNPTVLGVFDTLEATAPDIASVLLARGFGLEMVTLGIRRAQGMCLEQEDEAGLSRLAKFLHMYRRRASWMESHPLEVYIANAMAAEGQSAPFDWAAIFEEEMQ